MQSIPLTAEVMTPNPVVLRADDDLSKAAEAMSELDIRHLPVVDDQGGVIGLLSQRDLLAADDMTASVWSAMTPDVLTVTHDAPADEAARLLLDHKLGCLPVVDPGGIVGIVTETDFVRIAYAMLAATRGSIEKHQSGTAKVRRQPTPPRAKKRKSHGRSKRA